MHGNVSAAIQHGLLQLLDEQALAANFRQRGIQNDVALGFDADQLNLQQRVQHSQTPLDIFSLPDGERA